MCVEWKIDHIVVGLKTQLHFSIQKFLIFLKIHWMVQCDLEEIEILIISINLELKL